MRRLLWNRRIRHKLMKKSRFVSAPNMPTINSVASKKLKEGRRSKIKVSLQRKADEFMIRRLFDAASYQGLKLIKESSDMNPFTKAATGIISLSLAMCRRPTSQENKSETEFYRG